MIRIVEYTGDANILKRLEIPQEDYDRVVKDIVEAVRESKDEAVREYTANFDKVEITAFLVPADEMDEGCQLAGESFIEILEKAKTRIETYHVTQKRQSQIMTEESGSLLGQLVIPLQRAGVYAVSYTHLDVYKRQNQRTTLQHLLNDYPVFYKYFYYK